MCIIFSTDTEAYKKHERDFIDETIAYVTEETYGDGFRCYEFNRIRDYVRNLKLRVDSPTKEKIIDGVAEQLFVKYWENIKARREAREIKSLKKHNANDFEIAGKFWFTVE